MNADLSDLRRNTLKRRLAAFHGTPLSAHDLTPYTLGCYQSETCLTEQLRCCLPQFLFQSFSDPSSYNLY